MFVFRFFIRGGVPNEAILSRRQRRRLTIEDIGRARSIRVLARRNAATPDKGLTAFVRPTPAKTATPPARPRAPALQPRAPAPRRGRAGKDSKSGPQIRSIVWVQHDCVRFGENPQRA